MPPLPYETALAKLQRAFPNHDITIHDGDDRTESGLVESHGEKVASFRLTLREHPAHELPLVSKIRVGADGQFCGTAAEIQAWEQSQSSHLQSEIQNPKSPPPSTSTTTPPRRSIRSCSRRCFPGSRPRPTPAAARMSTAAAPRRRSTRLALTSPRRSRLRRRRSSSPAARPKATTWPCSAWPAGANSPAGGTSSPPPSSTKPCEPLAQLGQAGFEVELVPVTGGGYVEPDEIFRRLRPDTLLVSVMHANNETGVLQGVVEIGQQLVGTPTLFHVDAAQTFGKEVDQFPRLHVDLLSISGHKIYGPQGIGALRVRRRPGEPRRLAGVQFGGGQERGLRPGTVPVALAVGLGEAARLAAGEWQSRRAAALAVRKQLLRDLQSVEHRFNGDPSRCQGHVLNVSFPGVDSEALMLALRDKLSFSNGSACTSSSYQPSHVLVAMGLGEEEIESAVRISWGEGTMQSDMRPIVERVQQYQTN